MPTAAGTSVGANAANAQVQSSGASAQNNMSMAGTAGGNIPQTIYVNNRVVVEDTARATDNKMTRAVDVDRQSGQ